MPTKKIYTNTLAQIWGKVLTALISIFMIKVITSYLDIEWYGLYSKIYNYLSIFSVIADLGLYTITVRELSKYSEDEKMVAKISGNILSLRTLSGIIIIISSLVVWVFLSGYNSKEALIGIFITWLFTLAWLINSSLMSYLQANLKAEFSIISNTLGKLITFSMILLFALYLPTLLHTDKFTLVMFAGLIGNILMTGLTWWYANKYHPVRFAWDTTYIKHILTISLPYGLALFLNVIFFKVDTILLSLMTEEKNADTVVALYSLPMKIVEVGMMYGTIFLNSLLPILTQAIEKKDDIKVHSLTSHAFQLLFFFGVGIASFLYINAGDVIRLISTEAYVHEIVFGHTSVEAMRIVVWIFLFYFLSSLFIFTLIAKNEQKKMLSINAIIAGINIIGNIIIIPQYSFIGSAYVTLISQILLLIFTWHATRKNILLWDVVKSSICTLFFAGIAFIIISIVQTSSILPSLSNLSGSIERICILWWLFSIIYIWTNGWIYYYYKKIRRQ